MNQAEIILHSKLFIVGRPIDNDDSLDNRNMVDDIIKPLNARIVYYKELIQNGSEL